jgi:hypothetical protein
MIRLYMHPQAGEKFLLQVIWERNIQNCTVHHFFLGSDGGSGIRCFLKFFYLKIY